jgi:predicted O-methyltransferase YrrM
VAPTFSQVTSYASYWLTAVDEHSLHSPFFYDFYTRVVKAKSHPLAIAENLRTRLLNSTLTVNIADLGAGSVLKSNTRTVRDITRVSVSAAKYSALFARAIAHFTCKTVVELGTSVGINTLYLAQPTHARVRTFEGAPALAELARDTIRFSQQKNIELIEGNIDTTLPIFLEGHHPIDFAFVDANHRYEATLRYFELLLNASANHTVLVFDDIHLNTEMEKAWAAIKNHPLVYATADLYRCGFVFLDPQLTRQHWVLSF